MKNSLHTLSRRAILLLSLGIPGALFSQSSYPASYAGEAMDQAEEVLVFTDRSLYAVHEKIRFRSFCHRPGRISGEAWSRVLYVELLSPSGEAIAKGKFLHGENGSSGHLAIPGNALTGTYYLRAYTRWMRNFGPGQFAYVPLRIINPFSPVILEEGAGEKVIPPETNRRDEQGLRIGIREAFHTPGEEVSLELHLPASVGKGPAEYCLALVPAGLADTVFSSIRPREGPAEKAFSFDFLPDLRGLSLSGSVHDAKSGRPAQGCRIHFALLGDAPGYLPAFADEGGRFILTLPHRKDLQEMFVSAEGEGESGYRILIDQDFSTDLLPFATAPFMLPPEQREAARKMVLNMQFSRAYSLPGHPTEGKALPSPPPFYGQPGSFINLSKFIELPTMMEVFENLVPDALFVRRKGKPELLFLNSKTRTDLYPPLILVDHIPVSDLDAVLAIDPREIKRIEIVNEIYARGDMMFGGLISLSSRKGDMAGVDLAEGSYFFDYQCFSPDETAGDQEGSSPPGNLPDTRNTLAWMDRITLDPGGTRTVKFRAPSYPGEYLVMVRGMSSRGGSRVYLAKVQPQGLNPGLRVTSCDT